MAEERLGASFSIDVSQLQSGLKTANKLIRESQSEFRAAAAGMDNWSKSEEGLNARIASLGKITQAQQAKVRALKENYQQLINQGLDPASDRAIQLRTQINNEEAALASNQAELRRCTTALDELGNETEETGNEVEKTSDKFSKLGDAAKAAAKVAAAAVAAAAAGVVAITKQAVDSYAEYEQLVGGVETLFKDASDEVVKNAKKAYQTAGLSANDYMDTVTGMSASLIQSLGGDTAKAAKLADQAIIDMSDNANKMGSDIQSIQNAYGGFAKGNFTMLDNLKLGYGGTQKEMERLLADAQKISGIKYDISSYADVTEAIHVMQENMGIAGTTAKEASETISGSLQTMQGAWSNLLTSFTSSDFSIEDEVSNLVDSALTVVDNILPKIEIILESIVEAIEYLLPEIPPIIQELLPQLIPAVMAVIQGIIDILPSIIDAVISILPLLLNSIISMLPSILDTVTQIVVSLLDAITQAVPTIIEAVMAILPQLISSLIAAIPQLLHAAIELLLAIVDAIPFIIQELVVALPSIISTIVYGLIDFIPQMIDAAIQLFMAIIDAIPVIITALVEALPTIINTIIEALVEALPAILDGAIQLFMAIIDAIPVIVTALVDNLPKIITTIITTLVNNLPLIIKAAIELFMGIIKAIPKIIVELVKSIPSIIKSIVSALTSPEALSSIAEAGKDLIKGLWNGIKDMTKWIGDKIKGFGESVLGGLKDFFGIHSPSKVMENVIGKNLALGIGKGFEKNIGKVNDEIQSSIKPVIDINAQGGFGGSTGQSVVINQTNNYSQAHSRFELYKSKQQTAAAVRLAMGNA